MQGDEKTTRMRTSLRVGPACGSKEALDKMLGEAPMNHAWPQQMAGGRFLRPLVPPSTLLPFFLPPTQLSTPPPYTHIEPILKKHQFTVSPILHFPGGPILSHTGPPMSQWRPKTLSPCRPLQLLFPSKS